METGRKQKDEQTGITFWNIKGLNYWLDNFPVKGHKGYPLLFDRNL